MEPKTFTNSLVIRILDGLIDEKGRAMREKNLPFKLLYALRRSIPELEKAYKAYNETLMDICKKYDVDPRTAADADNEDCRAEVNALLNMEIEVDIHTVSANALDECDGVKYDCLTFYDVDRIWWLITE